MQSGNLSSGGGGGSFVMDFASGGVLESAATIDIPLVPPLGKRVMLTYCGITSDTSQTNGVSVLVNGSTVVSGTLVNAPSNGEWCVTNSVYASGPSPGGSFQSSGAISHILGGVDETITIRRVSATQGSVYSYQTGEFK